MARYTGPSWEISRRLGYSILENEKNYKNALCTWEHGQS